MTNKTKLERLMLCANTIYKAVEADRKCEAKRAAGNLRCHKDGANDWSAAAYYFGQLFGTTLDGADLREMYESPS